MKHLLLALSVTVASPSVSAADIEDREIAYARCIMQAYERGVKEGEPHQIYIVACMRVAGYEPDTDSLTGADSYYPVKGG
jgi:hypothetical protein